MATDWTHIFKRYKGQWVALADDETTVIAAAATAREAPFAIPKCVYSCFQFW